jgi:hypothetical protein
MNDEDAIKTAVLKDLSIARDQTPNTTKKELGLTKSTI